MIFIITRHPTHTIINCPPAGAPILERSKTANRETPGTWYIDADKTDDAIAWLKRQGVTCLTATTPITDADKVPVHCPHGIRWGHLLNTETYESTGGCNQCEWRHHHTGDVVAPNTPGARPFTYGWWLLWCQHNRPPGAEAERRQLLLEIARGEAQPEAMADLIASQKRRARAANGDMP